MTPEAKAENKACQAVVSEFRSALAQEGVPEPIIELCKQIENRIELRRLLERKPDQVINYDRLGQVL